MSQGANEGAKDGSQGAKEPRSQGAKPFYDCKFVCVRLVSGFHFTYYYTLIIIVIGQTCRRAFACNTVKYLISYLDNFYNPSPSVTVVSLES